MWQLFALPEAKGQKLAFLSGNICKDHWRISLGTNNKGVVLVKTPSEHPGSEGDEFILQGTNERELQGWENPFMMNHKGTE